MRDQNRIEPTLNIIKEIWQKHPDYRLTQLLLNLVADANSLYYVEDDVLIQGLQDLYEE